MEWTKQDSHSQSTLSSVDRIGFDMIRAIVSMRQASSPTAKAIAGADAGAALSKDTAIPSICPVDLLNGRRGQGDMYNIGAFMGGSTASDPVKAGASIK